MTTKKFATISTESYLPYTRMLYHSLMQSNPEAELTIFCDTELFPKLFGHSDRVRFRVLPSILRLGVKRARFDLYVEMCGEPFTYLDSDMIVLEDLSSLFTGELIAACPETFEDAPFIENPDYPWPRDPTLKNQRYCNCGLLFFPTSVRWFLESIRDLSKDDEWWLRYIIPGWLYDNHFFGAMLNRYDVEFRPLNPREFGIPGLRSLHNWNVARRGNHLIHQPTGQLLRVAHFAYGQDPDYCFSRMPVWLAAFLQERSGVRALNTAPRNSLLSSRLTAMRWIENENGDIVSQIQEDFHRRVLAACGREIDAILTNPARKDSGNESFFQYPEEFEELLYAHNGPAGRQWKGLNCNRAYLTPLEYEFVEECLSRYGIKNVVESGAGETSILFRENGCTVVSIEWQEGPWADRARASGASVHIVPFDSDTNLYVEDQLSSALDSVSSDLLFIDSPVGSQRRRRVPEQFLEFIDPPYILVHDVSRDHRNIFEWVRDEEWAIAEYYPSRRGILLLARKVSERKSDPIRMISAIGPSTAETTVVTAPAPLADGGFGAFSCESAVLGMLGPFWIKGRYLVPVALVNRSQRDLGVNGSVSLSYHWRKADAPHDIVVFDGERSEIRPDLHPGESRRMLCEILAPAEPGRYLLELDLIEEGVAWFSFPTVGPMHEVDILSAEDVLIRSR